MAINITTVRKNCNTNYGGIRRFWLSTNYLASPEFNLGLSDFYNALVNMTDAWVLFDISASFTVTQTDEGGLNYYSISLTFNTVHTLNIEKLRRAKLACIVEMNNGTRYLLGQFNGLDASVTITSGAALAEGAQCTVTLSGLETHLISNQTK